MGRHEEPRPKRSPVTEKLAKEVAKIQSQLISKGTQVPTFNGKPLTSAHDSAATDSLSPRPSHAPAHKSEAQLSQMERELASFLTIKPPQLKLNLHGRTSLVKRKKKEAEVAVYVPPTTPPPLTACQRLDMLLEPTPLHPSVSLQQRGRLNLILTMPAVLEQQDALAATDLLEALPTPTPRNPKAQGNSFSTARSMASTQMTSRHSRFRRKAGWELEDWRNVDASDQQDVEGSCLDTCSVVSSMRSEQPAAGEQAQLQLETNPADIVDADGNDMAGGEQCMPTSSQSGDQALSDDDDDDDCGVLERVEWVMRGGQPTTLITSPGRQQGVIADTYRSAYLRGMFPMTRSDARMVHAQGATGQDAASEQQGGHHSVAGLRSARTSMAGRSLSLADDMLMEESSLVSSILGDDDWLGPCEDSRAELQRTAVAMSRGLGTTTHAFLPQQPGKLELTVLRTGRQSGRRLEPMLQPAIAQPSPLRSLLVTPTKVTLPDSCKDGHTSPHSTWGRKPSVVAVTSQAG